MREEVACTETPFIDLIRDTWPFFQENLKITVGVPAFLSYVPFIVVGLPFCILAFVVAGIVAMVNKELVVVAMLPIGLVAALCFAAAYNIVRVGWTKIGLKIVRGEATSFNDLKTAMPWFVNFLLVNLIIGIATAVGACLLFVPGVLILVRCSFAPFLVVDENLSPIDAIIRSNDLVTGYSWQILGYYCFYFIGNLVAGAIPFGSFLLTPVAMGFFDLTLARIYDYRRRITQS